MNRDLPEQRAQDRGQVGAGQAVEPARAGEELVDMAPHELAAPDAVGRRAVREDARPPRAGVLPVGRARPQRRQVVEDRRVLDTREVLARLARQAGRAQHLEVLERAARRPVARSVSHSSVLPLRGVAQTR